MNIQLMLRYGLSLECANVLTRVCYKGVVQNGKAFDRVDFSVRENDLDWQMIAEVCL